MQNFSNVPLAGRYRGGEGLVKKINWLEKIGRDL